MNRLILLGNGFDLAHNLPTKYKDFIDHYLLEPFNNKRQWINNGVFHYEDENLDFKIHDHWIDFLDLTSAQSLIASFNREYGKDKRVKLTIKNGLLSRIIQSYEINRWVDIESIYYNELKNCIYVSRSGIEEITKNSLITLNLEFKRIQDELEKYLEKVQNLFEVKPSTDIHSILNSYILGNDLYPEESINSAPQNTMIVNLNYTNTVNYYNINGNHEILNIHGQIGNNENPIIFGFGDELDSDYQRIENFNENELMKFIKSFKYLETSNYRKLISFIDSNHFQVFTMGHSIGLSDRTMLNYIFESKFCRSIKIFYYRNKEDYIQKTYEISRHFTDKARMRNIIVSLDKSIAFPQVK